MLDKKFLKQTEKKLKEKRKALIEELKYFAQENRNVKGDFNTVFSQIGSHQDENALEVACYESDLSLEHSLELDLQSIERALKKIKNGQYGICEKCKGQIGVRRLKVFPEARFCMKCIRGKKREKN